LAAGRKGKVDPLSEGDRDLSEKNFRLRTSEGGIEGQERGIKSATLLPGKVRKGGEGVLIGQKRKSSGITKEQYLGEKKGTSGYPNNRRQRKKKGTPSALAPVKGGHTYPIQ